MAIQNGTITRDSEPTFNDSKFKEIEGCFTAICHTPTCKLIKIHATDYLRFFSRSVKMLQAIVEQKQAIHTDHVDNFEQTMSRTQELEKYGKVDVRIFDKRAQMANKVVHKSLNKMFEKKMKHHSQAKN